MGRQGGEPRIATSSVALLQERFRKLQRIKKTREEKERLRMFIENKWASGSPRYERQRQFLHPDMTKSICPAYSYREHAEFRALHMLMPTGFWVGKPLISQEPLTSHAFGYPAEDVDTSLHL